MSTTSLKLPEELKLRAAALAKEKGVSTHAFLLDAIEEVTNAEEAKLRMLNAAKESLAQTRKSGRGYNAKQVHDYIRSRAKGKKEPRPEAVRVWRD